MRVSVLALVTALLVLWGAAPVSAAPVPRVVVNGVELEFDVPPIIENGRTLVPLRAIFEALGAEIYWDAETQTVSAARGDTALALQIGNPWANVNNEPVALDVPAKIVGSRTLVPLRFISEALGAVVEWDQDTYTATISDAAGPGVAPAADGRLVGFWADNLHTHQLVDAVTGLPSGTGWSGEWFAFDADGTFRRLVGGCGPIICGLVIQHSKYEVAGSTLRLFEVLQDWVPMPSDAQRNPEYSNRPKDDILFTLEFVEEGRLRLTEEGAAWHIYLYPAGTE